MLASLLNSWRLWKNARAVALLAVAALTVGIGSATAIYSVVHAVLLQPLPYADPDRYQYVWASWRTHPEWFTSFSYPDMRDFQAAATTVETFGCSTIADFNLVLRGRPVHVKGAQISARLLASFRVRPLYGDLFAEAPAHTIPGALISAGLWRRLGSDPKLVGMPVTMNSLAYTISGVMPAWFHFPLRESDVDIWIPVHPEPDEEGRSDHYLSCVIKLKADVSAEQARTELNRILHDQARKYPGQAEPEIIRLEPVVKFAARAIRPYLLLLLVASGALFLITCANVASLLLARSVARSRETAIRTALGATRWQLGLQFFTEGLGLSLTGALTGSLLSFALVRLVLSLAADEIPRADEIAFNWQILLFVLAVAICCAAVFSIAPLWQVSHTAPNDVLSEGTRASSGARSRGLLRAFVVAEVALAFALLALGAIVVSQLNGLYHRYPGFEAEHLTVASMFAPPGKYKTDASLIVYQSRLIEKISHLRGIEGAGFTSRMPLVDWGNNTLIRRQGSKADWFEGESVEIRLVSPGYFSAMKIPLVAGRFFTEADRNGADDPILINQTLARLYWPHEDPTGSPVEIFLAPKQHFYVAGVVGDVRNVSVAAPIRPEMYFTYRENPPNHMEWALRSSLQPGALARELSAAAAAVDPEQPISMLQPMPEVVLHSTSRQRLQSLMVSFFAVSALLLAILGVYGVVSYITRQRITEIGTRMALGATPRNLLRLIVGDGLTMGSIGIALGLVLVVSLTRVLITANLLSDTPGALPFLAAAALITVSVLFACWFPAWRATTLSPMVAIHNDLHLHHEKLTYRMLLERAPDLGARERQEVDSRAALSAAIAESSRRADSFNAAIASALEILCRDLKASACYLFTCKAPDQPFRVTAGAPPLDDVLTGIIPADALLINRLRNYSTPLPVSASDLVVLRQWASERGSDHEAEISTLEHLTARLIAPVMSKSEMTGILILAEPLKFECYTPAQRSAFSGAAAQIAMLVENSRLTDRIVEQERLRRELLLASEIQKRLFPQSSPETTSLQMTGLCMPARGVGGDYYDFLDLGHRQIGIALADVAGKGIGAALIMSIVQASLRSLAGSNGSSLADLASRMNGLLHRSTGTSSYATFFYAQYDEERRALRYVNAGHNPPFLLRKAQAPAHHVAPFVASAACIEELTIGGTIIGMFAQADYQEATVPLASGDVLMAFSDGVTEAHSPDEEEFGEERLKDLLRRTGDLPINDMSAKILQELKQWMQDAPQHDDLTFILMKVC